MLSFVSGDVVHPDHNGLVASDRAVGGVVRWIRGFRAASAEFVPPPTARRQQPFEHVGSGVVAHNDLGRWNLVLRGPGDWAVIDRDSAAPADPPRDLAYAVHASLRWPLAPNPAPSVWTVTAGCG